MITTLLTVTQTAEKMNCSPSHVRALLVEYWPTLCRMMDEEAPEWREKQRLSPDMEKPARLGV